MLKNNEKWDGELFQRQGWGNFWEMGRVHAYGLFWVHRYHLELNWTEQIKCTQKVLFKGEQRMTGGDKEKEKAVKEQGNYSSTDDRTWTQNNPQFWPKKPANRSRAHVKHPVWSLEEDYWYYWSLLYSTIFHSQADSLRLHVSLHEWIAFYSAFLNIHLVCLQRWQWLVPHKTAAISAHSLWHHQNNPACTKSARVLFTELKLDTVGKEAEGDHRTVDTTASGQWLTRGSPVTAVTDLQQIADAFLSPMLTDEPPLSTDMHLLHTKQMQRV